ncbi:hypothetical protein B0H14DRAFT_2613952 [Mycena olivaceomarginata]|nr:hypothetical protein B0H14DRAFT_2613952 [Mycena olivaceomarginata]
MAGQWKGLQKSAEKQRWQEEMEEVVAEAEMDQEVLTSVHNNSLAEERPKSEYTDQKYKSAFTFAMSDCEDDPDQDPVETSLMGLAKRLAPISEFKFGSDDLLGAAAAALSHRYVLKAVRSQALLPTHVPDPLRWIDGKHTTEVYIVHVHDIPILLDPPKSESKSCQFGTLESPQFHHTGQVLDYGWVWSNLEPDIDKNSGPVALSVHIGDQLLKEPFAVSGMPIGILHAADLRDEVIGLV